MPEPVYGLTAAQHFAVGRLVLGSGSSHLPEPPPRPRHVPGAAQRIIGLGFDTWEYQPTEPRDVAICEWRTDAATFVVQFVGTQLTGDILLTIGGESFRVPCNANNAELREAVAAVVSLRAVRVFVLPGMWEFSWHDANRAPAFAAEAYDTDDLTDPDVFTGGVVYFRDAWRVLSYDGEAVETIPVVDSIPFPAGNVANGAVGVAGHSWTAGYMVQSWQCRDWSFVEDPEDDLVTHTAAGEVLVGGQLPGESIDDPGGDPGADPDEEPGGGGLGEEEPPPP